MFQYSVTCCVIHCIILSKPHNKHTCNKSPDDSSEAYDDSQPPEPGLLDDSYHTFQPVMYTFPSKSNDYNPAKSTHTVMEENENTDRHNPEAECYYSDQ